MTSSYGDWLNERLGKPVLWSKHAATTAISRDISSDYVKDAILYGDKINCDSIKTGDKITVKKILHDPINEALIVVYLDLPTHYYIISNHYENITQKIFLTVFALVVLSLAIDVFVKIKLQHKGLILRGAFYSFVLFMLFLLDKEIIVQLMPHNLGIL